MFETMKMRVAHFGRDFDALRRFYCDGLGCRVLAEFADHDFHGIVFGRPEWPFHFEFMLDANGENEPHRVHPHDLIALYVPDVRLWQEMTQSLVAARFAQVAAHNPYWDRSGASFVDPSGNTVVLQNAAWP